MTAESRRAAGLIAVAALCLYIFTAGGGLTSVDAVMTYQVTKNLVSHGSSSFDVAGLNHHRGVDGRYYSPFGIGQSIFNIPFYLAGRVAREWFGLRIGRSETIEKSAVALGSAVAAAGLVWVAYLFAWRLSGSLTAARRTALALGFGTLIWPYSKFGFSATLTGWCLAAGVYASWVGVRLDRRRLVAWGGVWLACAFLTRHEMAAAAVLVAAWIVFETRRDWRLLAGRIAWLGAPLAVALSFWLWYNFIRFGNPFETGNLGTDPDLDQYFAFGQSIVGIRGLLFSPGRSLFIYAPLTFAGVLAFPAFARRDRSTAVLFAAIFVSLLVLYRFSAVLGRVARLRTPVSRAGAASPDHSAGVVAGTWQRPMAACPSVGRRAERCHSAARRRGRFFQGLDCVCAREGRLFPRRKNRQLARIEPRAGHSRRDLRRAQERPAPGSR